MYKSTLASTLLYALEVANLSDVDFSELENTQVKILRFIAGRSGFAAVDFGAEEIKWRILPVEQIRQMLGVGTVVSQLAIKRVTWPKRKSLEEKQRKIGFAGYSMTF